MGGKKKKKRREKGAEGGEKYLYVGGSECWPLAPNQEGQGPLGPEIMRYCLVFCRIDSAPCRYLPIAEFFFSLRLDLAEWPFFDDQERDGSLHSECLSLL